MWLVVRMEEAEKIRRPPSRSMKVTAHTERPLRSPEPVGGMARIVLAFVKGLQDYEGRLWLHGEADGDVDTEDDAVSLSSGERAPNGF